MRRCLIILFLFALSLTSPARTYAQSGAPREADDSLVDHRTQNTLEALSATTLSLPDSLKTNHDAYLLLVTGAAFTEARLIAPHSVPALTLARDIGTAFDAAGLSGAQVEYSTDDTYSAARARVSEGKLGAVSHSSAVAYGQIVASLRHTGWSPHVLLIVPRYITNADSVTLPQERQTNTYWYDATNARADQTLTTSASLPTGCVASLVGFAAFVPVLSLLGLGAAIWFGSNRGFPIAVRRKYYPRIAIWPTYGAIALHLPFMLFYIRSIYPRVISDIWFGSPTMTTVLMPFIMVGPLLLVLVLPFSKKVERQIFGPSEKEPTIAPATSVAAVSPQEKRLRTKMALVSLITMLLTLGLIFARTLPAFRHSPMAPLFIPATILLNFAVPQLIHLFLRRSLNASERSSLVDVALTERAQMLAQKMRLSGRDVVVDRSAEGQSVAVAAVDARGIILVTQRLHETLSPAEIDFILAHELAHRNGRHFQRQWLLIGLTACLVVLPLLLAQRRFVPAQDHTSSLALMVVPAAGVFLMVFGLQWMQRLREYEADELALRTTGDLAAAQSALLNLARNSALPYAHEIGIGTHPALSRRLERLQKASESLRN